MNAIEALSNLDGIFEVEVGKRNVLIHFERKNFPSLTGNEWLEWENRIMELKVINDLSLYKKSDKRDGFKIEKVRIRDIENCKKVDFFNYQ